MKNKLKKVNVIQTCNCDEECRCGEIYESKQGDFYRVEDVDPILNEFQKLKDQISDLTERMESSFIGFVDVSPLEIFRELQVWRRKYECW